MFLKQIVNNQSYFNSLYKQLFHLKYYICTYTQYCKYSVDKYLPKNEQFRDICLQPMGFVHLTTCFLKRRILLAGHVTHQNRI